MTQQLISGPLIELRNAVGKCVEEPSDQVPPTITIGESVHLKVKCSNANGSPLRDKPVHASVPQEEVKVTSNQAITDMQGIATFDLLVMAGYHSVQYQLRYTSDKGTFLEKTTPSNRKFTLLHQIEKVECIKQPCTDCVTTLNLQGIIPELQIGPAELVFTANLSQTKGKDYPIELTQIQVFVVQESEGQSALEKAFAWVDKIFGRENMLQKYLNGFDLTGALGLTGTFGLDELGAEAVDKVNTGVKDALNKTLGAVGAKMVHGLKTAFDELVIVSPIKVEFSRPRYKGNSKFEIEQIKFTPPKTGKYRLAYSVNGVQTALKHSVVLEVKKPSKFMQNVLKAREATIVAVPMLLLHVVVQLGQ